MVKWFWAAVLVSFTAFAFLAFQMGISPRPIQVIRASLAGSPEEIGFWTYRQLRHIVFKHQIVVFGYQDEAKHVKVAKGFWESASKDGQSFSIVVKPESLQVELPAQTISLKEPAQALELVPPLLASTGRILLLLPSADSSHVVKDSVVKRLESAANKSAMSLSLLDWRPDHQAAAMVAEHCEESKKLTGFPDFMFFHCIYKGRAAKLAKLKKPEKLGFMVDQYGQADFVIVYYE
ncbi:MAG TPA: hypothetical protein VFV50_12520 [Bdellovibrionales bacterium]|nr:hypothetical protein [Bdellovibrionales bacterium]